MIPYAQEIFPNKYYQEVLKYKEQISELFVKYDVVIFMARKAICFYKAMVINEMLPIPKNCTIYSSRILTYSNLECLKEKK